MPALEPIATVDVGVMVAQHHLIEALRGYHTEPLGDRHPDLSTAVAVHITQLARTIVREQIEWLAAQQKQAQEFWEPE